MLKVKREEYVKKEEDINFEILEINGKIYERFKKIRDILEYILIYFNDQI